MNRNRTIEERVEGLERALITALEQHAEEIDDREDRLIAPVQGHIEVPLEGMSDGSYSVHVIRDTVEETVRDLKTAKNLLEEEE